MPGVTVRRLTRAIVLVTLILCPFWASAQSETPADVRLVIDISGSMKQTDPNNLRSPALELLVKLLPEGARAGVWTFGREVNMLVPLGEVDAAWQDAAMSKASEISSVGLFTNIGEALEKATSVGESASVILLTDGKVDIDKNTAANRRERERILSELLPELKSRGFAVHTIALSDDADKTLLERLSRETDAGHTVAESADDLMNTFLQIFERAVPAERLPLKDNRFLVDESVDEFTALIFRKPGAEPTRLIRPDSTALSAARNNAGTNWYSADSYDLITVSDPPAGEWQVDAAEAPQNRVTVVSDLQLAVEPLPHNIVAGRSVTLNYALEEEGEPITDPDFLRVLGARATIEPVDRPGRWQIELGEGDLPADGRFSQALPAFTERGDYRITLVIDGKTFAREHRHRMTVGSLFALEQDKTVDDKSVRYTFTVSADRELINVKQTAVVAHVKDSTGDSELRSLERTEPGVWQLTVQPGKPARYVVELEVSGEDAAGEPLSEQLPTQYIVYPDDGDPVHTPQDETIDALKEKLEAERDALANETSAPEPGKISSSSSVASVSSAVSSVSSTAVVSSSSSTAAVAPPEDEDGTRWWLVALVALANLALLGAIVWAYRKFNTRDVKNELDDLELDLQDDDGSGDAPEKKGPKRKAKAEPPESVKLDDDDPMAALDAMADAAPDAPDAPDSEQFPLDDESDDTEPPMDDLGQGGDTDASGDDDTPDNDGDDTQR